MPQVIAYRTALGTLDFYQNTTDWVNDVQGATTATFVNNINLTGTGTSVKYLGAGYVNTRGNDRGNLTRIFAQFTVPVAAQGNITGITLRFLPYSLSSGDVIVAKSSAAPFNGQYLSSAFGDISSTAYSSTINANGGSSPTWPTTTGTTDTFDITLNSTAISDANSNNVLNIVFMNYTYDFQVQTPFIGTSVTNGLRTVNGTDDTYGTRTRLLIDYATGYSNTVLGVDKNNIGEVIGVATANIGKVTGVQ